MKLTEEELFHLRNTVALIRGERCIKVDDDGCRCLIRKRHHDGQCDFSYTPFFHRVENGRLRLLRRSAGA